MENEMQDYTGKLRDFGILRYFSNIFLSYYSIIIVAIIWEAVGRAGIVPYYFLPPLSDVLKSLIIHIADGTLVYHTVITLFRSIAGYLLATVIGIPLGLVMARFKPANWFFEPIVALLLPLPPLTLVPAFILWFGIGHLSKIMMVTIACVFIITASTYNGVRNVNPYYIWSARSMGTSEAKILRRVILPSAMPFILNGLQVTLPISLIAAFVFEMVSGGTGLGSVEIYAARFFKAPELYSSLVLITLVGFILDRVILKLRSRVLNWY